ncbi:MAG: hypothetical protein CVU43_00670 [Chloroflexi bacterium HGW-Chloroflexi-5]|jgi:hypothetical protein|nr:MAG: hypothetical protein CVU43_00670 [Chloroflexi bacterium HGW-Chloroflexi-5]
MKILIRNGNKEKWELVQSVGYGSESELQRILTEQPSLISLNEVREGCGPLVVAVREFPLEIGSIDLIAFTSEGDIAVIECKLATNEEIKRKVIGQVMEYGANLWEMTYETLDQRIFARASKNLAELVQDANSDPLWDEEKFRQNITLSLKNGNFILIIVVDEIREELSRIVRFINDAGQTSFSFAALEMRRFHHGNSEMLVPHVFGSIKNPKNSLNVTKKKWDELTFFNTLEEQHPECVVVAKNILQWIKNNKGINRTWWGEGGVTGSFVPVVNHNGKDHQLFAIYTYGTLEVYFYWYQYKPPFDSEVKRKELRDKLNNINGINIPEDAISKRPNIKLSILNEGNNAEQILEVFNWVVNEIKTS